MANRGRPKTRFCEHDPALKRLNSKGYEYCIQCHRDSQSKSREAARQRLAARKLELGIKE
jgi:hypothetical protein